ncbi:hypothetical protein QO001_001434 [Methylobacterium brachiatum]|uniref:Uncharacterized protein n=1 Tax=Methylobacterium brachiatum TaxID=269660 RepID=A0AAJ1TKT7_9HYPH|nr:hypothetical protein [Methylobacterium brachiatum]
MPPLDRLIPGADVRPAVVRNARIGRPTRIDSTPTRTGEA